MFELKSFQQAKLKSNEAVNAVLIIVIFWED